MMQHQRWLTVGIMALLLGVTAVAQPVAAQEYFIGDDVTDNGPNGWIIDYQDVGMNQRSHETVVLAGSLEASSSSSASSVCGNCGGAGGGYAGGHRGSSQSSVSSGMSSSRASTSSVGSPASSSSASARSSTGVATSSLASVSSVGAASSSSAFFGTGPFEERSSGAAVTVMPTPEPRAWLGVRESMGKWGVLKPCIPVVLDRESSFVSADFDTWHAAPSQAFSWWDITWWLIVIAAALVLIHKALKSALSFRQKESPRRATRAKSRSRSAVKV